MSDRRAFLRRITQAGAALAGTAMLPSYLGASPTILVAPNGGRIVGAETADPKKLAARAMEAVRAAGADYADVRLTHAWSREMPMTSRIGGIGEGIDAERMSVGVRALVNGYWGFASGSVWSADEMARLAAAAVGLAKSSAIGGKPRSSELLKAAVVKDGEWTMPVREDPTTIPVNEVMDFLQGIAEAYDAHEYHVEGFNLQFDKQFKVFASLEGASFSQTTYSTMLTFGFGTRGNDFVPYEFLVPPGQGWGYLRDNVPAIRQLLAGVRAEEKELRSLPTDPIQVGKYDVLFDAASVGSILAESLGNAIQLDRALGLEANRGGTSFIDDPLAMVGNFEIAAPHITVTGSRSAAAGAAASVQWDDEGVVPKEFELVKNGILNEFPTTRDSASLLAATSLKQSVPVRSNGCARAPEGLHSPVAHTPNLVLTPGTKPASFHGLMAEMTTGLVVTASAAMVDHQALNGVLIPASPRDGGRVYKVKNGKRIAQILGVGMENGNVLFRTPNFWKDVEALGGAASARWTRAYSRKGEPEQEVPFDVTAVPVRVKQLSFINPSRRP